MRSRLVVIVGLCLLVGTPLFAQNILIFGPSMGTGYSFNEEVAANDLGYTVTVADASTWAGMTTSDFESYDAIIVGDGQCEFNGDLQPVYDNRSTWSAAVTGNVVIGGPDPGYHGSPEQDDNPNARTYLENVIQWVSTGSGTGFYYGIACGQRSDFLDVFGIDPSAAVHTSTNNLQVIHGHPVFAGLSDVSMSNWGTTAHEWFTSWPSSWTAIATDGDTGYAVVLANQGAPVIPALSPTALAGLALILAVAGFVAIRRS